MKKWHLMNPAIFVLRNSGFIVWREVGWVEGGGGQGISIVQSWLNWGDWTRAKSSSFVSRSINFNQAPVLLWFRFSFLFLFSFSFLPDVKSREKDSHLRSFPWQPSPRKPSPRQTANVSMKTDAMTTTSPWRLQHHDDSHQSPWRFFSDNYHWEKRPLPTLLWPACVHWRARYTR